MKEPVLFKDFDARIESARLQTAMPFVLQAETNTHAQKFEWKRWNEGASQVGAEVTLLAKEGSRFEYVLFQNLAENTETVASIKLKAEKNAHLIFIFIQNGSSKSQFKIETECKGEGSKIEVHGLQNAKRNQRFSVEVNSIHSVPHTQSDLKVWCVAQDQSHTIFNGLITIQKNAHHTEAYQKNKNLILSTQATVDSFPKLLIANDEVKCAHGSSTATLDEDQFTYFQSRGIDRATAETMLTTGFLNQALLNISDESVRAEIALEIGIPEEPLWTEGAAQS